MNNLRWNGNVNQYVVYNDMLDAAVKAMTGHWIGFRSRVTQIAPKGQHTILTVETCGQKRIVTESWKRFVVPKDAVELEEKETAQVKRKPGRPCKAV